MKLYERIENNNFDEIDKNRAIELIEGGNGHLVYNEDYFKLQKENEELNNRCRNLDKEAQAYLEELAGDNTLTRRTIKQLQEENEELKEKENKIYKEVQESLAFEKFLIVKERKPDLFNQGRFYISQIIYDILNDAQNPEGIHKENKCIQYIDYISVQKIKAKIEELDIAISECIYLDDDDEEYKKTVEKDKLCLLNQKRALQKLLEWGQS
jgi:hypothetical protein